MIPEDLMRKYKYGYVHSCEMLNEPFVKDLIKENQELNKENDRLAAKLNKNKILQNEFRKWLENESKELIRDAGYHQRICLDILEKYKEIIGVKMKYKKTFYFENGDSFKNECETDLSLNHFTDQYIDALRRGAISAETFEDEIIIIDLKKVQLISIKEIKDE